jgi:hypothetical protein
LPREEDGSETESASARLRERRSKMLRIVIAVGTVFAIALVAGLAVAQMAGPPPSAGTTGPGMMGPTMMGATGATGCPGMMGGDTAAAALTEEKAKVAAQAYADKYLKGFTVEKVLPFTGMHGSMYSVEMKGPNEEVRIFHVNPWGNVMPFGGPWRRTG